MLFNTRGQQARKQVNRTVNNNIRGYLLLNLDVLAMVMPVLVLLWIDIGLTFNQILLLQGIYVMVVLCCEVPSGTLADTWNRKFLVTGGQVLVTAGIICYLVADSFFWCIAGEIFLGLGQGALHGALEALLYDTLFEHGGESGFQATVRKEKTMYFLSGIFFAFAGGSLGSMAIRLPLLIAACFEAVITVLSSYLLVEIEITKNKAAGHVTARALGMFRNPGLLGLAVFSLSAGAVGTIVYWEYQNLLVDGQQFTPFMMGLLMAFLNLLAAISTWGSKKLENRVHLGLLVLFVTIDTVAIVLLMLLGNSILILLPVLVLQITYGSRSPLVAVIMNEQVQSTERATFISLNSAFASLVYIVLVAVINVLGLGTRQTLALMAAISIAVVISMIVLKVIQDRDCEDGHARENCLV